jgi:hypothetical protein
MEDDEFWTRPETAKKLRTPQATLAAWAYKGIGPRYYVVGRRALYRRSDVEMWLEGQAERRKESV